MRWFYLKDENKFPVACVASELMGDAVLFAISTYNPLDRFDREMARKVATGRLASKKVLGIVPANEQRIKERIVKAIAGNDQIPARTVRAAKYWLSQRQEKAA